MARFDKRLSSNAPWEFFVDSTCINCDTCRQLAPEIFAEASEASYVNHQPVSPEETRHALRAMIACPTSSIGTVHKSNAHETMEDFPLLLEDEVYYCGFNSPKSFGGSSYFVKHKDGNWLIDSPKFLPHLVRKFHETGGIDYIFLTHRDDVAEAEKYAREFGSDRIIHRNDLTAQPDAEMVIEGEDPIAIHPDFCAIPTPGHTQGHMALLHRNRFLFTGDHLWWNPEKNGLSASKSVCWYSWAEQIQSMKRLSDFAFEWILPGHGGRIRLFQEDIKEKMTELIRRMELNT